MKIKPTKAKYFVGTKKLKNVKLFEEFLLESHGVEEALTSGQEAAKSQGKDLLNPGQAAVAFVLAIENICADNTKKELCKKLYDKYGSANNLMTEVFGSRWKSIDFNKWKKEELIPGIRMKKALSLVRATGKMVKMISGDFSKEGDEVIYPLIEAYFKMLNAKTREELIDYATDFLKDPESPKYQAGYEEEA